MTSQAILALLDKSKSQANFELAANFYNECTNPQERLDIMHKLQELFYSPYEEKLRACYTQNQELLALYPYFWPKDCVDFAKLPFLLFTLESGRFYLYDKLLDRFTSLYDGTSPQRMRYFFENLDNVLRIEDEPPFNYEDGLMSDTEFLESLQVPFLYQEENKDFNTPYQISKRKRMAEFMRKTYLSVKKGNVVLPKMIFPDLDKETVE